MKEQESHHKFMLKEKIVEKHSKKKRRAGKKP